MIVHGQELDPRKGDELVSSLDRNSEDSHESTALVSSADTSGHPDKDSHSSGRLKADGIPARCVELNSWRQAEEHFRNLDQDQGRKHYDREMFNCELALNLVGIGTLYSCSGHLDGLPAFPYITIIPQRAVAGLVPRYLSMMETQPLSPEALTVKNEVVHAMAALGQHLLSLLTGFYAERQTPLPCHLVIQSSGLGSYTLLNQGAVVGALSDQQTLQAYQDEFMAFVAYLKSIWE